MKRMVVGAALLAMAPFAAQAQSLQPGGVYLGLEGGANWIFNSSFNTTAFISPSFSGSFNTSATGQTGYVLGVSCLSGYALDPAGRPAVAFSILANSVPPGKAWKTKQLQDTICRLIVDDLN